MTEVRDNIVALLPDLRAFARHLTANQAAADDLVNDTVVRALRAEHRFKPGTSLRSWLFTIERNLFLNERRNSRQRVADQPMAEDGEVYEPFLQVPATQDDAVHFAEAMRAWPRIAAKHRQAMAYLAAGWDYRSAAASIGIPLGTLKSRTARGRQELAGLIGRSLDGEKRGCAA
jgi:RNA polymerase sigma-70 factor (ECF subfamily)